MTTRTGDSMALTTWAEDNVARRDALLPIGNSIMVMHFMVMVKPDDPEAGTADSMNIKLSGSKANMKESVPFAAGLTTGQTLHLNVVTSDPGTIQQITLSLNNAVEDDPCTMELITFDENYGFPEDGSKKYTNFANDGDAQIMNLASEYTMTMTPISGYVVIVRTSSFEHAGTQNRVSIRFLGSDSSSEVIILSEDGFAAESSMTKVLATDQPMVTKIRQIEVGIEFVTDDLWMPDTFLIFTPYQQTSFHNSAVQFIGFKPYIIASDAEKMALIKAGSSTY